MRRIGVSLMALALLVAACGGGGAVPMDPSLFDTGVGGSYFDPDTPVLSAGDDWFTVSGFEESIIAVPAGWATIDTGDGTLLLHSTQGDPRADGLVYIASVRLDSDAGGWEESARAAGALEDFTNFIDAIGGAVTESGVLSSSTAYLAGTVPPEAFEGEGEIQYLACVAVFCSEAPAGVGFVVVIIENPTEGPIRLLEVYRITAAARLGEWDRYYPVFRHIASEWIDSEGNSLSVPLPRSLEF